MGLSYLYDRSDSYAFAYDFFEKDHLGNTRMVLTQEHDTTDYWASWEQHYRTVESQLFGNIASTCVAWTSMPNYQSILNNLRFGVWSPNDSVSKVDYTGTSGQTTGVNLLLKVMAGDTITPGVQCYYVNNTITTTNSSFSSVLNSLAAGIVGTPTGGRRGYAIRLYLQRQPGLFSRDELPERQRPGPAIRLSQSLPELDPAG